MNEKKLKKREDDTDGIQKKRFAKLTRKENFIKGKDFVASKTLFKRNTYQYIYKCRSVVFLVSSNTKPLLTFKVQRPRPPDMGVLISLKTAFLSTAKDPDLQTLDDKVLTGRQLLVVKRLTLLAPSVAQVSVQ